MAVAVLLLCVITLVIFTKTLLFNRKRVNVPPLAGGALPIVGHTLLALVNIKRLYEVAVEALRGPFLMKDYEAATGRIGIWDVYAIMNPDDCNLVAKTCLEKDPFVYKMFKPLMGETGLLTASVPVWKRNRKRLNPTFNQSVLDTYLTEFNYRSRELVNKDLVPKLGSESFDPLPYVRSTVLHIICATIMGVNVDEENITEEFGESLDTLSACTIERIRKFWYHSKFLFRLSSLRKKQITALKTCHYWSNEILRRKKANLIAPKDNAMENIDPSKSRFKSFLEQLLELPEDDALTEAEIKGEVNTFIAAGFDTTYHAIGMTLLTLGSYPEVQRKVFEEQQEIFEGTYRDVEKQDITKLKYLEAVIKETLRLYPIIASVGRMLNEELHFKNYTLPAGSRCFMSIYHLGRHPVWGPDAEQFRPERWLDGSLPTNAAKAFAAFGLGRRNCIGYNFAMMMMKTVLSHVVRRYRISGDVTQLVQNLYVVVTPVSGHHISIEQRT